MVTRYGQADIPQEVSGRGGPAVRSVDADFPRDVCLTVSRNHAVFLLYPFLNFDDAAIGSLRMDNYFHTTLDVWLLIFAGIKIKLC